MSGKTLLPASVAAGWCVVERLFGTFLVFEIVVSGVKSFQNQHFAIHNNKKKTSMGSILFPKLCHQSILRALRFTVLGILQ